jgi:hypothetical protein
MNKPLLIAESNPFGGDYKFALYPVPEGCSGWRLCALILGMWRKDYLAAFDRCNLVEGPWSMAAAKKRSKEIWEAPGRFVLFGRKVCDAFETPFIPFEISCGGTILVLPHPSGLNRIWRKPDSIQQARQAVISFVPEVAELIGKYDKIMQ